MSTGTERETRRVVDRVFDGLPRRYDALGYLLSFGQDRSWRREMVSHVGVARGGRVLDVATGTAGVALAVRRALDAEVVGIDINGPMLERARAKLADLDEGHVRLVRGRGEELPFVDGAFDAVTVTYLLRYVADPRATLAELGRVVRPGGALSSLDFWVPPARGWRALWWCYTRGVLPLAGLVTGGREWYEVGRFLGPNISGHVARQPLAQLLADWRAAGFSNANARVMSLGGGVVVWGTKDASD
ncbi:MAG: class I SAM-dependent methyltransferase [Acidimicrobiales bacterium]